MKVASKMNGEKIKAEKISNSIFIDNKLIIKTLLLKKL